MGVGQDLHLDVARPGDQPLDEQRRRRRTPPRPRCGSARTPRPCSSGAVDGAHAAPAAAGRGLQHHRVADLGGDPRRLVGRRHAPGAARRRPGCRATGPAPRARDLVAEQRQRRRRRADEGQALGRAALGERGVLGQEAVAGVDAVAAAVDAPRRRWPRRRGRRRPDRRRPPIGRASVATRVCSDQRVDRRVDARRTRCRGRRRPGRCGWRSRRGWRSAHAGDVPRFLLSARPWRGDRSYPFVLASRAADSGIARSPGSVPASSRRAVAAPRCGVGARAGVRSGAMGKLPLLEVPIVDYGDDEPAMVRYREEGEARARALDNRGPIRFDADGQPRPGDPRRLRAPRLLHLRGRPRPGGARRHRARRRRAPRAGPGDQGRR